MVSTAWENKGPSYHCLSLLTSLFSLAYLHSLFFSFIIMASFLTLLLLNALLFHVVFAQFHPVGGVTVLKPRLHNDIAVSYKGENSSGLYSLLLID